MKTKLTALLLLSISGIWAQGVSIFLENAGTPIATTTITSNIFQNSSTLTFSDGGQAIPAEIRISNPSSGYAGASAVGNVFFEAGIGNYGFSIEGIQALNAHYLLLQFAYSKVDSLSHADFSVDYYDGSDWITIANTTNTLFNEPANAVPGWYLSKALQLPVGAQINNLKIRFVKTGSIAIAIDDIQLLKAEVIPEFSEIGPICQDDLLLSLPTTSLNGITGAWSPALDTSLTTTYIFTPDENQNALETALTIEVNMPVEPIFNEVGSVCFGSEISELPTTSLNNITGSWSPALDNTTTATYTFTPDAGQCASVTEMTITINSAVVPTFESAISICSGSENNVLETVSPEGITGTWLPEFDSKKSQTYTFTPDQGQCATTVDITIESINSVTPLFAEVTPICSGGELANLPATSLNGIEGQWFPELNNIETTTYTFTPDTAWPCATLASLTIAVNPVVPIFDAVAPICAGEVLAALPVKSNVKGITGTWSPELNNTQTTVYTFTPDVGQCASSTTLTIVVNQTTPVFDELLKICEGTPLADLPTISSNGITGEWKKETNETGTVYTFVPDSGQCAKDRISITATQNVIPTFVAVEPIGEGKILDDLPTTSLNGISGAWSPELNNMQTTSYVFLPSNGQCATQAEITIEIIPHGHLDDIPPVNLPPTGDSNEVGVTNGELSVSPSGSALYTIPIAVPPGINGVVPQLALSYNSQSGVGLAGYGWNITGLSAITRIPSTKFHDGIIDPVDFDENDRFALDGQRLMLKSGTYGATNSVYETENFSNVKITKISNIHFRVEYPDGSVANYGGNFNSVAGGLTYALSSWENPQGIGIMYTYTLTNNNVYISSIKYGAAGNGSPINEIQFIYKGRAVPEQYYSNGSSIKNNKILSAIKVIGNNIGFRNYILKHDIVLGYERLKSITEKNGDGSKSYNPTIFEYNQNDNSNSIVRSSQSNFIEYLRSETTLGTDQSNPVDTVVGMDFKPENVITGDFNGDGDQDFIYQNKIYSQISDNNVVPSKTFIPFVTDRTDETGKIDIKSGCPVKCLEQYQDGSFKPLTRDAWCYETEGTNGSSLVYSVFSKDLLTNNVTQQYTKYIELNQGLTGVDSYTGDFDGDGLTDKLVIKSDLNSQGNIDDNHNCHLYFVNLDRRITSNYVKDLGIINAVSSGIKREQLNGGNWSIYEPVNSGNHIYIADANNDGKSDIIVFKGSLNKIVVYTLDENNNLIQLFEKSYNFTKSDGKILYELVNTGDVDPNVGGYIFYPNIVKCIVGDLNGDGNADIILPGLDKVVMMSTGTSFEKEGLSSAFPTTDPFFDFLPVDINDDRKMDVLAIKKINEYTFSLKTLIRKQAGDWTSHTETYNYSYPGVPNSEIKTYLKPFMVKSSQAYPGKPQLLMVEYSYAGSYYYVNDFKIGFYTYKSTMNDNKLINTVTIGNGVKESINYAQMINGNGTYLSAGQVSNYPTYDILNAPGMKIVSQIGRLSATGYKKQAYQYYGATTDVEGLGFLGFRAVRKTNWYATNASAISTITKFDINLRGAATESFSVVGLLPPTTVFDPTNYISRTLYSYNNNYAIDPLLTNKVFKLRNTFMQDYNGLNGAITDVTLEYDDFNLKSRNSYIHNTASASKNILEKITYNPSSVTPYIIGTPGKKEITITLHPEEDISKTEEEYLYNETNLLKQIKKRNINSAQTSEYIIEDNEYDEYGNVTAKTISAGPTARTSAFKYDDTHRFLTEKTDMFGLKTKYTYDLGKGLVLSETMPSNPAFPVKTSFIYDSWGKKIKTINYLGTTVTTSFTDTYTNLTGATTGVVKTTVGNNGIASKTYLDDLGRKTHEMVKNINDNWTCTSTKYDINDRPVKVSQPYFANLSGLGNYPVWNEIQYNVKGQLTKASALKSNVSAGKVTTYEYDGLTTIEIQTLPAKTKTTVKDIFGNITSIDETDAAQVTYAYYANNSLKSTTTAGATTSIEQDAWGRKKTLIDPSAGEYNYTYSDFGELKTEEVVGKGTTIYTLDDYGRVTAKEIIGNLITDFTRSKTDYIYDPVTQLLTSYEFTDMANDYKIKYLNTYDFYNRLKKTREVRTSATVASKKYFEFGKDYSYDAFGRIEKERYYAKDLATNKVSDKWIKYTFKNGYKWQLYDMLSETAVGTVRLWQTNTANQQGSVLTGDFGNGVTVNNSYDFYGFPKELRHSKGTTNIMTLDTEFDSKTGNLNSRKYNLFGSYWTDNLTYDHLDRLTAYNTIIGLNPKTQTYSPSGNIVYNEVGTYAYHLSGKPYALTTITPDDQSVTTSDALIYYNGRRQEISYNLFKSPVTIREESREKVDFEYNADNGRSVMYYGSTDEVKINRPFRKFYSADGSMEIRRKTISGNSTDEFVTYIGGDGYSASVVLKSDGTTPNYFYLHRDYQGSILAITNSAGIAVEKRLFDVWGALIKYSSGSNTQIPTLSTSLFLARGYTGHEHLLGVGLINMNGRIYDPKLHKFLQPDNNIQDPFNTQNFNRYGYCMNNPTKYTDQTGEFFWPFVAMYFLSAYIHGAQATGDANPFNWNAGQFFNAFAAPTFSVASTFTTNFANNYIDTYNTRYNLEISNNFAEGHGYVSANESGHESLKNTSKTAYNGPASLFQKEGHIYSGWFTSKGDYHNINGTLKLGYGNAYFASSKYGEGVDMGFEGTIAKWDLTNRIGSEMINAHTETLLTAGSAQGNLNFGMMAGQRDKIGPIIDANIGAYGIKSDFTVGGSFFGLKYDSTFTGSAYSAHIGGTFGAYYNSADRTFLITGGEHVGWVIGEGASTTITVPVGYWTDCVQNAWNAIKN